MAKRDIVYVPILKSKAGERWALSHLSATGKAKIRPLLELHPPGAKTLGEHVESVCDSFQSAWGVNRWFYADTIWLHGGPGSPAIIGEVYEAMENNDLQVVPVVRPTYEDASLDQLANVIAGAEQRGCMLRIGPEVLNTPALIASVVDALGVARNRVDLLLDYRQHPMTLAEDVPKIPDLTAWRMLIAASGVFPKSLASYPLHQWHDIPRNDWLSWEEGVDSGLPRKPVFGDYAMRPPGAPADFGDPSVNLRYALDDHWLVRIGGKHKEGAAIQMHGMCDELVHHEDYSGPDFSQGDEEIDRVTDPEEGPGGPTQWLQWCVSHHLEFVAEQISPDGA